MTESGTSRCSGSGLSLSPAQDVFFSSSKSVRIPARGRARQVALPMHLYFRNKEAVSLPHLQQLMSQGSLVWLHWNLGWEDKNRVRGTCRFQPDRYDHGRFIGAVAWIWVPKNVSFKVARGTRLGSVAVLQSHNNVLVPARMEDDYPYPTPSSSSSPSHFL